MAPTTEFVVRMLLFTLACVLGALQQAVLGSLLECYRPWKRVSVTLLTALYAIALMWSTKDWA